DRDRRTFPRPVDRPADLRLPRGRDLPEIGSRHAGLPAAHGLSLVPHAVDREAPHRRRGCRADPRGLHRNNYFVSFRAARPEPVFQYHPMLREFLRARSEETLAKDRRRQMQRDAAAAMEAAGSAEDALALHRDSHDWDDMARVIEEQAEAMLAQGRGETLRH